MAKHISFGRKGEQIARRYLMEKGYKILDVNWRHERDEIDIVAMDADELVFAEVKTRATDFFGEPEEAVGYKKQKFLVRAAEAYIEEKDLDIDSRFDIVAIVLNDAEQKINHITDAFYPE